MGEQYVVWFDEDDSTNLSLVGGKFANLSRLHRTGIRVPPAFSVSSTAYRIFTERIREKIRKLLVSVDFRNVGSVEAASAGIREVIRSSEIPEDVMQSISSAYRELGEKYDKESKTLPVAVRSSATAEDLPGASLAGQHETYLWVRGEGNVVRRVAHSWASMFTARALTYRHTMGIDHFKEEMSVIVQKMVNPIGSGVMFTLNPTNGDPSKIVVESSWGLGEAIVSGLVTPDLYMVDKVTFEILKKDVKRKLIEHVVLSDHVEERAVPEERQNAPSLSDQELLELAKLGKRIEKEYGSVQDIEWAIDSSLKFPENIFILQTRPETVWSRKKRAASMTPSGAIDLVIEKLTRGEETGQ